MRIPLALMIVATITLSLPAYAENNTGGSSSGSRTSNKASNQTSTNPGNKTNKSGGFLHGRKAGEDQKD